MPLKHVSVVVFLGLFWACEDTPPLTAGISGIRHLLKKAQTTMVSGDSLFWGNLGFKACSIAPNLISVVSGAGLNQISILGEVLPGYRNLVHLVVVVVWLLSLYLLLSSSVSLH